MANIISYAVIALDRSKVDDVIWKLKTSMECYSIREWLKENKCKYYGNFSEDWKPFGEDKIGDIIEENSDNYNSETHLIERYLKDYPKPIDISHIKVFFIDMFSMYLKEYSELARMSDLAFCSAENNSCCFLIDYNLPDNVQKELEGLYIKSWPLVAKQYKKGCLHRMAARIDDLNNFKNYLQIIDAKKKLPNPGMISFSREIVEKVTGEHFENNRSPIYWGSDKL